MWGPSLARVLSWLRHGQCEVTILRGGRQGTYGVRVGRSIDSEEHGHILDIIDIDDLFEYNGQATAVQSNGKDGGGEGKLAYNRRPLERQKGSAMERYAE